jgi:two-component system, cell cycle response regulator
VRRVLVVDDDSENIELLTKFVTQDGHSVQSAADGETALHRLRAWKPHLVLLDVNMPKTSGIELIPKIRALTSDEYCSIILVSADMSPEDVKRGLDAGADDYLTKPFRAQDLVSRIRAMLRLKEAMDSLRRANHRIEELSSTDELTGLYNMRAIYRRGEEEILRAKRFRKPVSALLVNIDNFSDVNQNYSFIVGSHVLQEVAMRLKQCLRSIDLVARVGADEFFVLLSDTDLAGAEFIAERVRDIIQSAPFKNDKQMIRLTATVGVAGITAEHAEERMTDLLRIATEALRSAKANGSNRVEVYSFT